MQIVIDNTNQIRQNNSYQLVRDTCFTNCIFAWCNFTGAKFMNCIFDSCDFNASIFQYAIFDNCGIKDCRFNLCDLQFSEFTNSEWVNIDISGANLYKTNLNSCKQTGIKSNINTLYYLSICPNGEYIGYIPAITDNRVRCIVEIKVTDNSLRSSATSKLCRASRIKVLEIATKDYIKSFTSARDIFGNTYVLGKFVNKDFDKNRWNETGDGILHYLNRQDAIYALKVSGV